jgi:ABC-2 type transport system ATP-binding protein
VEVKQMPVIETENLCKKFGVITALNNVSFSVAEGALFGLIGADGAGKTTLLRILVTLIAPDSGSATVLGSSVIGQLGAIRRQVGYMPQRFSLYQDLSVRENLEFFADVFGVSAAERSKRIVRLLEFSRLAPFQGRRAAHLSGGMKQKLALSCALIHTPRLLILDEPTTGVDPVSRNEFWDILFELKRQGITIIVSTPYMDEANSCDSLLLLHKGAIMEAGAPAALLAAYPLELYKISASDASITAPPATPLHTGIALMYPAAGALHVAARKDAAGPEAILAHVKIFVPAAETIEAVRPTIEDLFFYLLSGKGAS